ncbi:MAG: hypothetical protein AAF648_04520 [Pseudomonadota bacterium]
MTEQEPMCSNECPPLTLCAAYADGALSATEAAAFEQTLERCATCRRRVAALSAENRALSAALAVSEFATQQTTTPAMEGNRSSLLTTIGWLVAAAAPINAAVLSIGAAVRLPGWLSWMVPDAAGYGAELAFGAAFDAFLPEWSMIDMIQHPYVITAVAILVVAAILWRVRRPSESTALVVAMSLGALLLLPSPDSHALDFRRSDDRIVVGADEVIEDTVVLISDSVLIEGTVTGDLVAIGDRVVIRGTVNGSLITFADNIDIEGVIGGSLVQAGSSASLTGATVQGNWLGAGETLTLNDASRINGNALLAAARVEMDGRIERDLFSATEHLAVNGQIGGNLNAAAERVTLNDGTLIGGDLNVRADPESVSGIDRVSIAGTTAIGADAEDDERSSSAAGGLVLGVVKLLAALLTGWLLFRVVPALERLTPGSGNEGLITLAIGLAVLVGAPIAALIIMLTLIGAPLGIALFALWVAFGYVASIVTARWIGGLVLGNTGRSSLLLLLTGLVLVAFVTAIPFLGDALDVVATLLGLGMLGRWAFDDRREFA